MFQHAIRMVHTIQKRNPIRRHINNASNIQSQCFVTETSKSIEIQLHYVTTAYLYFSLVKIACSLNRLKNNILSNTRGIADNNLCRIYWSFGYVVRVNKQLVR